MKASPLLITLVLVCFHLILPGQTAGSGTLSRIESLAEQELKNSEKVGDLNRKHMDTYVLEDLKLKRLEQELRDLEQKQLQTEMAVDAELEAKLDEIENGSSWINRRESAARGFKEYNPGTCSAGGPPPICVADHWYRVSVDEAMREYDALVERELNKIRDKKTKANGALNDKKNELYKFQFEENEFAQKRESINDEMNELISKNSDIRAEIEALSRQYIEQIKAQAESKFNSDLGPWLNTIAQKHYAELKIGVLEAKMEVLDDEEVEAIQKLKQKLNQENQQEINEKEQKTNRIKAELTAFMTTTNSEIKEDKNKLSNNRASLKETNLKLEDKDKLPQEEVIPLEQLKLKLEDEIDILEKAIEQQEKEQKDRKDSMEGEVKQLDDEVWNLKINLPTLINEEVSDLKEAFASKRGILEDAKQGRKLKLQSINEQLSDHEGAFRSKVSAYSDLVEPERLRLMDACKKSGSSCWGSGIVGDVWGMANTLISCAHQLENNALYYTGCEEASESYRSNFNSMVNGMSDSDLGILRRKNSEYQYEKLLKKFN
jgi:DNA repair exonuclease SbcCD ATPase subunit